MSTNPSKDAQFYIRHFGFQPLVELDWYVSLHHPELSALFLDFIDCNHAATAESQRGHPTSGLLLGFVVADVHAEAQRLREIGLPFLKEPTDEVWGQRRFQVAAPGNVVVEILQRISPDPDWLKEQEQS